jgi:hypothetical protein
VHFLVIHFGPYILILGNLILIEGQLLLIFYSMVRLEEEGLE